MKRQKVKLIACLLLVSTLLIGCGHAANPEVSESDSAGETIELITFYQNYQAYTKYLTQATYDNNDLRCENLDSDDTNYAVILYNKSETLFVKGVLSIYDKASDNEPKASMHINLIRPNTHDVEYLSEEQYGEYTEVSELTAYAFNYDATIDYYFLPDNDGSNIINDIFIDDVYTLEDVKSIAQREYIINVLTNTKYAYAYFFDGTHAVDSEYPDYPDLKSAVYIAQFDYGNKVIHIIHSGNPYDETIESITME